MNILNMVNHSKITITIYRSSYNMNMISQTLTKTITFCWEIIWRMRMKFGLFGWSWGNLPYIFRRVTERWPQLSTNHQLSRKLKPRLHPSGANHQHSLYSGTTSEENVRNRGILSPISIPPSRRLNYRFWESSNSNNWIQPCQNMLETTNIKLKLKYSNNLK